MNINRQIQVKSFIETKLTLMKLIYLRIVSIQSAGIYPHIKMFYIIIIELELNNAYVTKTIIINFKIVITSNAICYKTILFLYISITKNLTIPYYNHIYKIFISL